MKARRSNDYLIDWETHKARRMGIAGVNLQDVCITENEGPGPIMDRTKEHLCAGDISTIKARLKLLMPRKRCARKERFRPARAIQASTASVAHLLSYPITSTGSTESWKL